LPKYAAKPLVLSAGSRVDRSAVGRALDYAVGLPSYIVLRLRRLIGCLSRVFLALFARKRAFVKRIRELRTGAFA
jgi:hypothetical protein